MTWLKENYTKIFFVLILLSVVFLVKSKNNNSSNSAIINQAITSNSPLPITATDNPNFTSLIKSLPHFEDYPAKVFPIPPRPLINHQSNPYGMRFWTALEDDASTSYDEARGTFPRTEYDMGGHYLMNRHGTGNPDVLIVDGLTGKVFNEYGGINYTARVDSSLVIFEPFVMECFTPNGDYECGYDTISGGGNPRYAKWNGEQFVTICEPVVKNWKVVSCGEATDKTSDLYGRRKVSWMGTVVAKMTYGRLRIKSLDRANGNVFTTSGLSFRATDNLDTAQYGYSEFVAEPDDVDDTPARASKMTADINDGDLVQITGYWEKEYPTQNVPWVLIERIERYSK